MLMPAITYILISYIYRKHLTNSRLKNDKAPRSLCQRLQEIGSEITSYFLARQQLAESKETKVFLITAKTL